MVLCTPLFSGHAALLAGIKPGLPELLLIVRDIELSDALDKLLSIIVDGLVNGTIQMDESVRGEILNWYVSQPNFIQVICGKQLADAGLLASTVHGDDGMSTVV